MIKLNTKDQVTPAPNYLKKITIPQIYDVNNRENRAAENINEKLITETKLLLS
jgi:hypothetical protein